ncbi:zinc finger protein 32-like isoform X1 [Oncorhynchus tshawytscha]|uniref:C2H2-type domain-containing protein n=1 Tax=Oncorhynchus tshawytscha TaxID=74940 RepID=A0AAZ3RST4_ONCTS|nr:zinc finger protein 32-like isoform X1 [Oncorhynchus tshawytscha]
MSRIELLKSFFNQRLAAAAEEIFRVVEKTIAEYQDEMSRSEERNSRLQKLLDITIKPEIKLYRADTQLQQLPACGEQVPSEQEEWIHSLGQEDPQSGPGGSTVWGRRIHSLVQEDPQLVHIKEEQQELWTSLGEGQESDTTEFIFTSACVQSDCNQDPPQPSHLYQTQSTSTSYEQLKRGTREDRQLLETPSASQPISAVKSIHPSSPSKSRCKVCGKMFLMKSYFFKHVRMHTKMRERVCGVCGKQVEVEAIKDHVEAHIDAQFTCQFCSKGFTKNNALRLHMRIHTGEKPYRCSVCGRGFAGATNLTNHMRIHTGYKPHRCTECGRCFSVLGHLQTHMRSHTGEKPYRCTVCGKGFSVSCNLTQHMMIHTGERPYHCPDCQKGFITMVRLRRHQMAVHMQGEMFFCNEQQL